MYAVIKTGGKQYRVSQGEQLTVERVGDVDQELTFTPLLLVDGDDVVSQRNALSGATVQAKVVAETKGPKIAGFTYKPKTNQRRRWGHRQQLATIEITGISRG